MGDQKMEQEAITESTGYLLAHVCKTHRNKAAELLAAIDLYVGQEMFLLQLWRSDGLNLSEMAELVHVQPATASRMLDRLEAAGLVKRRQDSEDGRVSRIFLTQEGHNLREPVRNVWAELESISMANLTTDERILLRRLLLQVYQNLTEGN
ncbi:MAG: MarR family transcriptional regulator [Chloroflexi bacterium]|nr:MarR family transcriptional regulator [Chloroflexota bacterium]MCI0772732.1 MarR family transcriptional regulator [Chloroflexota bacterium]MCI0806821.1 MarR family transcriptional regulator [Chloroflexota bacterium]MCI0828330.1 MarR family transcriptional regulator [Chloroflexota bacterium]MCI0854880.1 MarR family transcriptional regulator [Chloroflexota bacterium]